jgi:hypothetical protein
MEQPKTAPVSLKIETAIEYVPDKLADIVTVSVILKDVAGHGSPPGIEQISVTMGSPI